MGALLLEGDLPAGAFPGLNSPNDEQYQYKQ